MFEARSMVFIDTNLEVLYMYMGHISKGHGDTNEGRP